MRNLHSLKVLCKKLISFFSLRGLFRSLFSLSPPRLSRDTHGDANRTHAVDAECGLRHFLSSNSVIQIGPLDNEVVSGPMVSLVVVLFNQAPLTFACLQRISSLQYRNIELIIVDNASTDSTSALLRSIKGRVRILSLTENFHFLRACNLAFRDLSPESAYVSLVNNDALLSSQVIDEALSVFSRWPNTGIVGGQILHLDGQLQEAGNTLFQDGSCRGIGRRQSPWHSLVQVRRKVDYISGCFLMIPTSFLRDLGGFDERFMPAYYEETDLCVESWKRGRPVVYEPRCRVYHVEYASSRKGNIDAIQLMQRNRILFHSKHQDWLIHQRNSEHFADLTQIEHCLRPQSYPARILWIDDRLPDPGQGAGFGRLQAIIEQLADLDIFVTLFATDFPPGGSEDPDLRCHAVDSDYELQWGGKDDLRKLLENRDGFYTHIVTSRRHNISYLKHYLRSKCIKRIPLLVGDIESIFSIRQFCFRTLQKTNVIANAVDLANVPEIESELREVQIFDRLMAVSEQEKSLLQKHTCLPVARVGHAFSIPLEPQLPRFENTRGLIFMGAMNFPGLPNLDSLAWLADSILPVLLKLDLLHPESAPLTIIGPYSRDLAQPSLDRIAKIWPLRHLGRVEDVEGILRSHRLLLAPTRYASGLPHKVQHAISQGLPVVTTELIATQMGWTHGEGLAYSNDPEGFARTIAQLYTDQPLWENLQTTGLQQIRQDCSPSMLRQALIDTFLRP